MSADEQALETIARAFNAALSQLAPDLRPFLSAPAQQAFDHLRKRLVELGQSDHG